MDEKFLKVAKEAALEAGKVIKKYSGKMSRKYIKNDDISDVSTDADLEAEKTIIYIIKKTFPKHNFISEENEKTDKGSEFTWVIDPLDGSFSFMVNMPTYGVSIGLLKNNQPVLGVLFLITLNRLYWAQKGKGAYMNGKKLKVTRKENLDDSAVVLDLGHRAKRKEKINLYVNPLINKVGYDYSLGSAVADLGFVAEGILDASVTQAWLWDFVAGTVIIREAGGKITDFQGNEPDWSKERLNIVASNGLIHDEILEALKK